MKKRKTIGKLKKRFKPSSRVFPWVVDNAAFFDKVILSVHGELKENFEYELVNPEKRGILRPGTIYSRAVRGIFGLTGNPLLILYGRTMAFRNTPFSQVVMPSESVPVTAAQAALAMRALGTDQQSVSVSSAELTFDVTNATTGYVLRHLIHRSRQDVLVISDGRRRTLYVGSPRSAWQVRIYRKRRSVLRLEFILRRQFLAKHGINRVEDLVLLRCFPLWDLVSFRRFSRSSAIRATEHKSAFVKELIVTWGATRPTLQRLPKILKSFGIDAQVLRPTDLQRRLQAMQRHLIW